MNKKHILLALLITLTVNIFAQEKIKGNKNVTIVETETNPFNKIVLGEKFEVTLKKGDYNSVEIETDENLHDVINIGVADSTLNLNTTKRITFKKALNITVRYTDALKYIVLNDDAQLYSDGTINNSDINLTLNNNAKAFLNLKTNSFNLVNNNNSKFKLSPEVKLNIESTLVKLELNENSKTEALITCDTLKLDMYQRATTKIEGNVKQLNANTINSTSFNGKNLTTINGDIIVEDTSDFSIQSNNTLNIEASGNTTISIYGEPNIKLNKFTGETKLYKKEL